MRKLLLLGAATVLATTTALAQQPMVLGDFPAFKISPNGKIVGGGANDNVTIFYVDSEDFVNFNGDDSGAFGYSIGQGNCITDSGIIVGESKSDGGACWYKDGEWHALNVLNPSLSNLANGITPDGSRICGSLGLQPISIDDTNTPMLVPAVWNLQSDGTYGDPVQLPYPALDFTGRVPQYVTANWISDDGKTVIGQVQDYQGFFTVMIWYRLGDDNEWTYTIEPKEMYNPNNVTFPEYPGDGPVAPNLEDYMTPEEQQAYQDALDEWTTNCQETGNWDYSTFPQIENFVSEEGKAAYNEAYAAWQTEYNQWSESYNAFMEAYYDCVDNGISASFNTIAMSPDGKLIASYTIESEPGPDEWSAIETGRIFTINTDDSTYRLYPKDNTAPCSISSDYTIFANTLVGQYPATGVVYKSGEETMTPIVDYVATINPENAEWMKENMFHDVEAFNWETGESYILEDLNCTGYPTATPDKSTLITFIDNVWDMNGGSFFGYYIPLTQDNSVKGIATDGDFAVKALKGGRIILTGEVLNVAVYDVNGHVLFNGAPQGNVIETGLTAGAYIVKATGANGEKVIKAIF